MSKKAYKIKLQPKNRKIVLKVKFPSSLLMTNKMPLTVDILKRYLPGIFLNKCHNGSNHSFKKEARNTEIGHLFEHILMESLVDLYDDNKFVWKGLTRWNWIKDPKGTFEIIIEAPNDYQKILDRAMSKSSKVLDEILMSIN